MRKRPLAIALFAVVLLVVTVVAAWLYWDWAHEPHFHTYQSFPLGDDGEILVQVMTERGFPDSLHVDVRRGGRVVVSRARLGRKEWDGDRIRFQVRTVAGRYTGLYVDGYPRFLLFVYDPQTGDHWNDLLDHQVADRTKADVEGSEGKPFPLLADLDWLWAKFIASGQPSP